MRFMLWLALPLFFAPGVAASAELSNPTDQVCRQPAYDIVIDFSDISLYLFDGLNRVAKYPVALPRVTPKLPATGKVVRIIKDPVWYPTESTRKYYLKKKGVELPKRIEPGAKNNAMGKAKMMIVFDGNNIHCAVRVHGTNDPTSIGKRVSRGCIRMHNRDILALHGMLNGQEVPTYFVP